MLVPIYVPSMVIGELTGDGREAPHGKGWYQEVWNKPFGFEKFIAIVIAPFVFFNMFFLRITQPFWEELMD